MGISSRPLLMLILKSRANALTIFAASSVLPRSHIHCMESSVLYKKCGFICACNAFSSVFLSSVSSRRTCSISCFMRPVIWPKVDDITLNSFTVSSPPEKVKPFAFLSNCLISRISAFTGAFTIFEYTASTISKTAAQLKTVIATLIIICVRRSAASSPV